MVPDGSRNGSQKDHKEATLNDVLRALVLLTNEVAYLRVAVDPKQRLVIVVISAFLGGVLTNLILWLLGLGTIFGLHHAGIG